VWLDRERRRKIESVWSPPAAPGAYPDEPRDLIMRKGSVFAYPGFPSTLFRLNPLPTILAVSFANPLPRRHFLKTSAACGMAAWVGCSRDPDTKIDAARPDSAGLGAASGGRTDVPLRVLVCGDQAWADGIATAWGGISEQPLAIEVIPNPAALSSGDDAGFPPAGGERTGGNPTGQDQLATGAKVSSEFVEKLVAAMRRSDVGIVPCGVMADLDETASSITLGPDVTEDAGLAADRFFPVISQSLMRWRGEPAALPLGCVQPAMLIAADLSTTPGDVGSAAIPETWERFIEVAGRLRASSSGDEPTAAEPLAGGAAAKMFLWRANDAGPSVWLFDRETFAPALTDAAYVRTLETMRACAATYGERRLTAGEVWGGVASGKIKLAIGWPGLSSEPPRVESIGDVLAVPMPRDGVVAGGSAISAVLPDPDAPIGLLSERCRQSSAAKRFLIWISGGDGSEMVRRFGPGMTAIRGGETRGDGSGRGGGYEPFLKERLASPRLRPTVRLHGYDRYMAALDHHVLACLDGDQSPADALAAAAESWATITAQIGTDRQMRAWRLAQGLRN